MLGAVIGDIVGSRFEFNNYRHTDFEFFHPRCRFTDDSVLTLALCRALLNTRADRALLAAEAVRCMQEVGRPYDDCGYGGRFFGWMYSDNPQPYNSFGNGSAMRVSGCAWAAQTLDEVKEMSLAVTAVSHNHPEGIKGAEATAVAAFMARQGASKEEIRACIERDYYHLDFTLDAIRPTYQFNEICQDTVPQALQAFMESTGFEDAIRLAISLGGDSDTLGAITGAVAEAFYGVPRALREQALSYLDKRLLSIVEDFEAVYPAPIAP